MLPLDHLKEKLSEAYKCASSDDVQTFQTLDAEINALVIDYVQHIKYASTSVTNLNGLQWSSIFTQIGKILGAAVILLLTVLGMYHVGSTVASVLSGVAMGIFLTYIWKKIPQIRQLRKDIQVLNDQSLVLTNSVSQSILAINYIKQFQIDTIPTVDEWKRKGMLDSKAFEDEQFNTFKDKLNESLKNIDETDD